MHAVLGDINRRNDFYALGNGVVKRQRGIGNRPRGGVVLHDVEVATIYLINMIVVQEGPFSGVESQVGTPIVHGVAGLHADVRLMVARSKNRRQQ